MTFGGGKNTVQVRIVGDASQFKRETKSAEKSSQTLVGTLKKHAGLIKGFLAVQAARAVKDFVSGSVRAFSDLNESINAVEVTFGDAAEGVLALGENAAESLGLANAEFNTLAVGFAAFVQQIAAEKDGDVVAVMKELTLRVADFASVMNIDVTEAADKFRSGLAGESEPLRKFGLDLSAATANVRGLELGLGDASGKLSEQEKVLARYSLIMEQTEKVAGDFANTSDDLANRQRILRARFIDVQAEIGANLVPAMEALLGLGENLIPVIGTLGTAFAGLTGTLNVSVEALKNWAEEHGKEATTAEDVTAAIIAETDARRNWVDFLLFGIGPLEAASKALREHLQQTELTVDEIEAFRVAIKKAGDENLITAVTVEILNGVLDDQAAVLGNKVLKATQDVRDAVLDGLDPALHDLTDTTEDTTEAERDQRDALDETRKAIERKRDAIRGLTSPAFALIKAAQGYTQALEAQTEALDDATSSNDDLISAGVDVLENYQELLFAADEYATVTGTTVRNALLKMAESGQVPLKVVLLILEALNAADDFAGEATLTLDYIEKNRAALERFLAVNVGTGSPGGGFDIPSNVDIGGIRHTGGRVNAPRGQEVLVRALGGETFSNPAHSNGGGGGDIVMVMNGREIGRLIRTELIRQQRQGMRL